MTWFKVDDSLAFHRKVVAAGNAAMGLWVRAGSWCAQQLTDGFVPDHMIPILGTPAQASRLVRVGLWITVPGGCQFHEWNEKGRQPTAQSVREEREKSAERQAKWRAARSANRQVSEPRNGMTDPFVTPSVTGGVTGAPTRPDPTRTSSRDLGGGAADPNAHERPHPHTPRCEKPCRVCRDARLAEERAAEAAAEHERELAAADAHRARHCRWCNADGWRIDPDNPHRGPLTPGARCDHRPVRLVETPGATA
jgi:hypothetical protein